MMIHNALLMRYLPDVQPPASSPYPVHRRDAEIVRGALSKGEDRKIRSPRPPRILCVSAL